MSGSVGQVELGVAPDLEAGAFDALDKDLTSRFTGLADRVGTKFKVGVGAGIAGIAGVAGVAKGLKDLGGEFDDVFDGIATTTGAAGAKLDDLKQSFRNVARDVPADFATIGDAIAKTSQASGLAGKPLDDLTAKYVRLADITKGDLNTQITASQKLFKDFGLSAGQGSEGLDKLYKLSASTGVGFDQLTAQLDKFGPQLRQMGLDFDASAALAAKLTASGVDASKVLGGLGAVSASNSKTIADANKSVGDSAKLLSKEQEFYKDKIEKAEQRAAEAAVLGGEKAKSAAIELARVKAEAANNIASRQATMAMAEEHLADVQAKAAEGTKMSRDRLEGLIASMQAAPSATLALADAQGVLGKKVGIEFVDAVRSGKLSVEDLTATLGTGGNSITETSKSTADGAERMQLAMNRVKLALEPVAAKAFEFSAILAEKAAPIIEKTAQWIADKLVPAIGDLGKWINDKVIPVLHDWAQWFDEKVVPAIGRLVDYVVQNWPKIQEKISDVVNAVKSVVETVIGAVKATWESTHDRIEEVARTIWDGIKEKIKAAMETIQGVIETITSLIKGDWGGVWDGIKKTIDGVWDGIQASVKEALRLLRDAIDLALDGIVKVFGGLGGLILDALKAFPGLLADTGKRLIEGLGAAIQLAWEGVKAYLVTIPTLAANAVGDLFTTLKGTGRRLIDGLRDGIDTGWDNVVAWAGGVRRAVADAVGDLYDGIKGTGRRLIEGLRDGITGAWDSVKDWLTDTRTRAATAVGDLYEAIKGTGARLVSGMWDAMKEKWTDVTTWLAGLGQGAKDAVGKAADLIGDVFATALKLPINAVIGTINSIKFPSIHFEIDVPDWVPGMPDKLKWSSPEIDPFPDLKPLAHGIITDRPLVGLFGEAGTEAVLPLSPSGVGDFRSLVSDPRFLAQMDRAFGAARGSLTLINNAPPVRELDERELMRLWRRGEMLAGMRG